MVNLPKVRLGIVAVSRDCFPKELSRSRLNRVVKACATAGLDVFTSEVLVESERDALAALEQLRAGGVNALVIYLGNFGPEGPETYLAQEFRGPVMIAAAAEESADTLIGGRGDAYCGLLNCSYNLGLRGVRAYIPENPVGTPGEIAGEIMTFQAVARALLGVRKLKLFSFGPRPYDFLACNAPIKPLYDLGVTVMENSELDLLERFQGHSGDGRIEAVAQDMARELGAGNRHPALLPKLAQYELTLLDFLEDNLGCCDYGVFANKCWPAFQTQFGFVPCYVHSRLTGRGVPVACETDLYGALSEYIVTCVTQEAATLLDINNTVPADMAPAAAIAPYRPGDLFMGFHCGNTASCMLRSPAMSHQRIMKSLLEPDGEPDITRGTLEGRLKPGGATIFRLQSTAGGQLRSYVAEGEILDLDPRSFGSIGVFAIPEMRRFYRHVLLEKQFPHHTAVAFRRAGKMLFEVVKALGVEDIAVNRPASLPYAAENPF